MADILPTVTTLAAVYENEQISLTFTPQLDVGETLVSINIIDHRPNVGIVVSASAFSGQYRDSFQIGDGALKVRNRKTGIIETYSSWEALPPPQDADLFSWEAPSVLKTTYTYTVKLVYEYAPVETPGISEIRELTKTYSQIVYGKWNTWAKQLRDYVSASGPLPK